MVYLDYSATSPLLNCAKTAMLEAMNLVGNPSALHTPGHLAKNAIEDARTEIAALINAEPSEIIFTSGGSESNNTVTNIFAGESVAISAIEHPSLLESAKLRCQTTIIPVDKWGEVTKGELPNFLRARAKSETATEPSTGQLRTQARLAVSDFARREASQFGNSPLVTSPKLISVMLANNEIGTINDVKSLAQTAHEHGVYFHTDATQALGKIKIDAKDLGVDYMTISAHKIGGPVGIGALYVKNGAPFKPLIVGGHQEKGRRAGTYQTVNIAGFGAAAKYAREHQTWKIYAEKIRPLRDKLAARILAEVPFSSVNGKVANVFSKAACDQRGATGEGSPVTTGRAEPQAEKKPFATLPNLLNCSFEAAEGESIQLYLDAEGDIIVSTGSACASGNGKPSHVIMATRNDAEIAHSSIRFSLGLDTTTKDINHIMQYLPDIVKRLQSISTIKTKDKRNEK